MDEDAVLESVLDKAMEEIKTKPCEHLGCERVGCWLCTGKTIKWAMKEYHKRKSAGSRKESGNV